MDDSQAQIDSLKLKLSRNRQIYNGLKDHLPFKFFLEDFSEQIRVSDSLWHTIPASKYDLLAEERIKKLAALVVIESLESYQHDIKLAEQQLNELEHPEQFQRGYYDKE